MEAPAAEPEKTGPSARAIVLWGAGMLVALALAWFVGAVAVPVWQTRVIMREYAGGWDTAGTKFDRQAGDSFIERLGGPERAARRLSHYIGLPRCVAPHRDYAWPLLTRCQEHAEPALKKLLGHREKSVRGQAELHLECLREAGPKQPE